MRNRPLSVPTTVLSATIPSGIEINQAFFKYEYQGRQEMNLGIFSLRVDVEATNCTNCGYKEPEVRSHYDDHDLIEYVDVGCGNCGKNIAIVQTDMTLDATDSYITVTQLEYSALRIWWFRFKRWLKGLL